MFFTMNLIVYIILPKNFMFKQYIKKIVFL